MTCSARILLFLSICDAYADNKTLTVSVADPALD